MAEKQNRYREMERYMTYALIGESVLFVLYLICAGFGVVWLKIVLGVVGILVALLGGAYLYLTGELLRPRSRWMSAGFAAVLLCLLLSLILNYPSPNPAKAPKGSASTTPNSASTPAGDTKTAYTFAERFSI